MRGALAQNEQAAGSQLQAARERWTHELAETVAQAGTSLSERFASVAQERAAAFENQLDTRISLSLEKAGHAAGDVDARLGEAQSSIAGLTQQASEAAAGFLQEFERQLQAKSEQSRAQLADLDQAALLLHDRIAAASAAAQSAWQSRLDADLAAAADRWNGHLTAPSTEQSSKRPRNLNNARAN
jgi:hypothetical protein